MMAGPRQTLLKITRASRVQKGGDVVENQSEIRVFRPFSQEKYGCRPGGRRRPPGNLVGTGEFWLRSRNFLAPKELPSGSRLREPKGRRRKITQFRFVLLFFVPFEVAQAG